MKCPGCNYERKKSDNTPEWQCPACKIAYNKHPKYSGNNYHTIELTYQTIPPDTDIKAERLYLYLIGDRLEGAVLSNRGKIERIQLTDDELGKYAGDIKTTLRNPPATLSPEQQDAIFTVTAIRKNQHDDKLQGVKEQKTKTRKLIILVIFSLLFLIMITRYYPSTVSNDVVKPLRSNTFPTNPVSTKNHDLPTAHGFNLELIATKLSSAATFAKQCKSMCKSQKNDEYCVKAAEIMNGISVDVNNYKEYMQVNSIDRFDDRNKMLVGQINQYLWDIPKQLETAASLCQRSVIQTPTYQIKTSPPKSQIKMIDFMSQGINLNILYSKVFTADNQIRDCRLHCEVRSKAQDSCSIFIALQKEYKSEVEALFRLFEQYSLTINSNQITGEDKKYIELILGLLEDIEKERKKIIECLDSLKR